MVRIGLGLLWIANLSWKVPPEFGRGSGGGLYGFVSGAIAHPVLAPYSWLVEHAVLPQILLFAWGTVLVETALAVLLLTGTLTRLAALLGIAQSVAIGLSVAATPNEWVWSYLLMALGHLAILGSSAVAMPGVDGVLGTGAGRAALAVRQLTGWGVAAVLVGLWGGAASLGDPLATAGTTVGVSEVRVGQYNLLGGVVLILLGAGLIVAGRRRDARLAQGVALVALLAAVTVAARWGFGFVPLGGDGSSTAFYLALAVVGALMGRALAHPAPSSAQDPAASRAQPAAAGG